MSYEGPSSGASPAGSDTQIQYNNSGALGADANFTWDGDQFIVNGSYPFSHTASTGTFSVGNTALGFFSAPGDPSIEFCCAGGAVRIGDPEAFTNGTSFIVDDANQKTTSNVKHYADADIVWTNNTSGPVIKDTSNGHWYRIKVTAGALGVTDLGTSLP